jgi:hypothetical protein
VAETEQIGANLLKLPSKVAHRLEDLNTTLASDVDAATLGMLTVSEGHLRYYRSHPDRRYHLSRWTPVLRIHMADEQLVRWASRVMGGSHVTFDKSMGAWYTEVTGVRAIAVLQRIRPFIRGEKEAMIDCILAHGKYVISADRPCVNCETRSVAEKRIADLKERGLL